jgi:hypothetical protein
LNGLKIAMVDKQSEIKTDVDVDAVLAAALRIFAARGRAIREERAKMGAARLLDANAPNVLGDQETGSTDQDTNKDIPNP